MNQVEEYCWVATVVIFLQWIKRNVQFIQNYKIMNQKTRKQKVCTKNEIRVSIGALQNWKLLQVHLILNVHGNVVWMCVSVSVYMCIPCLCFLFKGFGSVSDTIRIMSWSSNLPILSKTWPINNVISIILSFSDASLKVWISKCYISHQSSHIYLQS